VRSRLPILAGSRPSTLRPNREDRPLTSRDMRGLSQLSGPLLALLLLLAPASAFSQTQPHNATKLPVASSLRAGDFIVVKIWREPELSDTVQIDNDGVAVFPKLGSIEVRGLGPDSLERLLVSRYSQSLQNPSIRVTVLRRITVWGAVARPGPYPVDLTMTITDALALAGGATPDGKSDRVELRRGGERKVIDLSGKTRVDAASLRSGDQLFVPQKSWLSRNAYVVVAVIGTATSLAWFLTR
jgi:protein involved in polysaccharide export with SLBB domain